MHWWSSGSDPTDPKIESNRGFDSCRAPIDLSIRTNDIYTYI